MTHFRITYIDPETGEPAEHEGVYHDSPESSDSVVKITAREWAEDHAYTLADKGAYQIKEIP